MSKSKKTTKYIDIIKRHLVTINDDGSIFLDQSFYNYSTGLKMIKEKKWEQLFALKTRTPEDLITQDHCDIAIAIQKVTEEIVLKMAKMKLQVYLKFLKTKFLKNIN